MPLQVVRVRRCVGFLRRKIRKRDSEFIASPSIENTFSAENTSNRFHNTFKAGVAFYGSLADQHSEAMPQNALDTAAQVKEPVLGLYGAEDQGIPVEQVNQMKDALAKAGKTAEFKIYPGAPHGFHADYRASYRKEAAEDGWSQMQAWFKKYKVLG